MRKLCLLILRLLGWDSELVPPPEPKGLIFVYPHTSNWDFPIGVLFRAAHGLNAQFIAKDELFRWPVAGLLRWMGGIPVNRRAPTGFMGQIVDEFRQRDWLWIAITPEGTRSYTEHLKSGFYQIALAADVPLGLGYIDWGRRRVAIDTYVRMTGDKEKDLQVLRDFYADKRGRRPEHAGRIRFRD